MDSLETNLALVKAIKQYPCLYDNTLPAYTKKDITDKAWSEVSNEIGIPAPECKWKWKNLRWGFIRSLRPNPDGSVKKKYYLHDQMDFVIPYIKLLPKNGSYIIPPQIDSDTEEEHINLLGSEFLEYETVDDAPLKRFKSDETSEIKQTTEKSESFKNGVSPVFCEYDALQEPQAKRLRMHEPATRHLLADSRRMFLLSLLPEVNVLSEKQMKAFRRQVFQLIDNIVDDSPKKNYASPNKSDTLPNKSDASEKQTPVKDIEFRTEIIKTEILE